MSHPLDICCCGEVMVEFSPIADRGLFRQGFAGDTFNTAIYLARAGLNVGYATRLGDDTFSGEILDMMRAEGIDVSRVEIVRDAVPGLYTIRNDANGDRTFNYWRSASPARQVLDRPLELPDYTLLYLSGITLAITREHSSGLGPTLMHAHGSGAIAMDTNYRPVLWDSPEQARELYDEVLPYCDWVFSSFDDDRLLWGVDTAESAIDLYRSKTDAEIIMKCGAQAVKVWSSGVIVDGTGRTCEVIDTTGAGDAFSAAYLAARLSGSDVSAAIAGGHNLAGRVVGYRGAILPPANRKGS